YYYLFFQAEDGIRDRNVTGVQTCALPISSVAKINETTAASPPPNKTAFVREILNLSAKPAIYVSHIDINEVKPARTKDAKNKNPKSPFNAGNSFIIAGNTTNASPTPPATTSSTLTPA